MRVARTLHFTKMHGIGNDYIYFDCTQNELEQPEVVARHLSHRHFGVGGDGVVLILPSTEADFRMRMFNSDGSEGEMCGNAVRCIGKYLYDRGLTQKKKVSLETKGGVRILELIVKNGEVDKVRVDMGEPILEPSRIPVESSKEHFLNEAFEMAGVQLQANAVSMGNPHVVFFVPELSDELVLGLGPKIEIHPLFPNKVNVEFIKIIDRENLQMRVWERGAGETWACGTGASAAVVAGVLNQLCQRQVTVQLLGGELEIEWAANNHVYKTGPATIVFDGTCKTWW